MFPLPILFDGNNENKWRKWEWWRVEIPREVDRGTGMAEERREKYTQGGKRR